MAALEVAPLIATPAEPPARNDAAEIKLDPIAVELAPEPTPEAAESSGEPALELAATPEDPPSLATATALPMELDAPAAAADPQPTTLAAGSETIERMPQPEAGGPTPLAASTMTSSAEASEAAAAAAPTVPVELAVEASPAEPIAASAPALLPEQEVPPPPAAAPLPQGLIEPAIEEPPAVEVEAAVVAPSPGLPAEPQSGAGAPEPDLSVGQSAPAVEPLQLAPFAADDATAEPPPAQPVATEAPAPDVTVPPAEPETPPAEPESAGLADFLLEPLPPPVTGGATTQSHSGPGVASTMAPSDPMAEIEEELFATAPQATANVVPPPFDPAATLRPSAPMPVPGAAVPAADRTRLGAGTAPPQPTPSDPLAALKAMTDEERIALFT
jgi:hypothetical protein